MSLANDKFTLFAASVLLFLPEDPRAFSNWKREQYERRYRTTHVHWNLKHPERSTAIKRNYYLRNTDKVIARARANALRNPAHTRARQNRWQREQQKNNPAFRALTACRQRLRFAIMKQQRAQKHWNSLDLFGVRTAQELREKIERTFKPGFSWANYGIIWEIDHIRPCSSFNLTDLEAQKRCFHWTNLQALSSVENRKKSAKWEGD